MNSLIRKKNFWPAALILFSYTLVVSIIAWIGVKDITDGKIVYLESFFLSLLPLVGGSIALVSIIRKKAFKTAIGSSVFIFSLGLLSWGFATIGWVVYNVVFDISVPFPSLTDIGYVLSPILFFIGIILLSKATGLKYQLRKIWGKILLLSIPVTVVITTFYFVFFKIYANELVVEGSTIETILQIYYPLSDIVILSAVLIVGILSWKSLGGSIRKVILTILFSFIFLYFADLGFSYATIHDLYDSQIWMDFLYATSLALLSLGIATIPVSGANRYSQKAIKTNGTFSEIALKIIQEEERVIGSIAWEIAFQVEGLSFDDNHTLKVSGNGKGVVNGLIFKYEQLFGNTSRQLAKDIIKEISTASNSLVIDILLTLDINNAFFLVRQKSTNTFTSTFPYGEGEMRLDYSHPIVSYLENHKNELIRLEKSNLTRHNAGVTEGLEQAQLELKNLGISLALGAYSDNNLIGILLLGSKVNGQNFSSEDLNYITNSIKKSVRDLGMMIHFQDTQVSIIKNKISGSVDS